MFKMNNITLSIILYALCSGSLLLLNKLVIHFIPLPSGITIIQLVSAVVIVCGLASLGFVEIGKFTGPKVKPYLRYTVLFVICVYTNVRALQVSNVETVIVFRCMTPLIVAMMDYSFMGRALPSRRSFGAMTLIIVGALGYVSQDKDFGTMGLQAYTWAFLYLIFTCVIMLYGKKLITEVKLSLSESVLYTNAFSILPMLGLFLVTNESAAATAVEGEEAVAFSAMGIILLIASCFVGTGIGYASWWCRSFISATSYTIVGVVNKMATVLVNSVIWDNHASMTGIMCLCLCLVGGALYQQAPMRLEKLNLDQADEENLIRRTSREKASV